jgi:hypothetical protein
MLQELTHMDRITQLQDEIQNVGGLDYPRHNHNASNQVYFDSF